MSHEFPHDKSPEHYQPLASEQSYHHHEEPVDPFGDGNGHYHQQNVLGHDKEALLVDLDSSEPVATHHQIFSDTNLMNTVPQSILTQSGINMVNMDPEPPNVNLYDSQFHTEREVDIPHYHDERKFDSPSPPHQRKIDSPPPLYEQQKMDSPQLPDEPSPTRHFDDDDFDAHHSPLDEERRHIEENIQAAVHDTHDEVDAILERLGTPDPAVVAVPSVPENDISPSGDSERDTVGHLAGEKYNEPEPNLPTSDSTQGIRDNSPDEEPFARHGPLTIPSHAEKNETHENVDSTRTTTDDDFVYNSSNFNQLPPRSPTPPKDLDDGEVKPTSLNLGPAPVHQYEHKSPDDTTGLKPILKHHSDIEPWLTNHHVDQRVLDIIYWRDPKKSGIVLASIFVTLFLLAKFSLISLVSYSAIAVLIATLGFRIFKIAEAKFKKTEDKNPFQPILEKELDVPQEKIHAQVDVFVENARNMALQLRRLFFVENVVDSVKFFFLLYSLTYIGAWFSGCTLIILFIIGVFTIPKVYEMNKEPIDNYLNLAKDNVDKLHQTVGEKLPFLKPGPVAPAVKKDE